MPTNFNRLIVFGFIKNVNNLKQRVRNQYYLSNISIIDFSAFDGSKIYKIVKMNRILKKAIKLQESFWND